MKFIILTVLLFLSTSCKHVNIYSLFPTSADLVTAARETCKDATPEQSVSCVLSNIEDKCKKEKLDLFVCGQIFQGEQDAKN